MASASQDLCGPIERLPPFPALATKLLRVLSHYDEADVS